jgi:hypothetical protein
VWQPAGGVSSFPSSDADWTLHVVDQSHPAGVELPLLRDERVTTVQFAGYSRSHEHSRFLVTGSRGSLCYLDVASRSTVVKTHGPWAAAVRGHSDPEERRETVSSSLPSPVPGDSSLLSSFYGLVSSFVGGADTVTTAHGEAPVSTVGAHLDRFSESALVSLGGVVSVELGGMRPRPGTPEWREQCFPPDSDGPSEDLAAVDTLDDECRVVLVATDTIVARRLVPLGLPKEPELSWRFPLHDLLTSSTGAPKVVLGVRLIHLSDLPQRTEAFWTRSAVHGVGNSANCVALVLASPCAVDHCDTAEFHLFQLPGPRRHHSTKRLSPLGLQPRVNDTTTATLDIERFRVGDRAKVWLTVKQAHLAIGLEPSEHVSSERMWLPTPSFDHASVQRPWVEASSSRPEVALVWPQVWIPPRRPAEVASPALHTASCVLVATIAPRTITGQLGEKLDASRGRISQLNVSVLVEPLNDHGPATVSPLVTMESASDMLMVFAGGDSLVRPVFRHPTKRARNGTDQTPSSKAMTPALGASARHSGASLRSVPRVEDSPALRSVSPSHASEAALREELAAQMPPPTLPFARMWMSEVFQTMFLCSRRPHHAVWTKLASAAFTPVALAPFDSTAPDAPSVTRTVESLFRPPPTPPVSATVVDECLSHGARLAVLLSARALEMVRPDAEGAEAVEAIVTAFSSTLEHAKDVNACAIAAFEALLQSSLEDRLDPIAAVPLPPSLEGMGDFSKRAAKASIVHGALLWLLRVAEVGNKPCFSHLSNAARERLAASGSLISSALELGAMRSDLPQTSAVAHTVASLFELSGSDPLSTFLSHSLFQRALSCASSREVTRDDTSRAARNALALALMRKADKFGRKHSSPVYGVAPLRLSHRRGVTDALSALWLPDAEEALARSYGAFGPLGDAVESSAALSVVPSSSQEHGTIPREWRSESFSWPACLEKHRAGSGRPSDALITALREASTEDVGHVLLPEGTEFHWVHAGGLESMTNLLTSLRQTRASLFWAAQRWAGSLSSTSVRDLLSSGVVFSAPTTTLPVMQSSLSARKRPSRESPSTRTTRHRCECLASQMAGIASAAASVAVACANRALQALSIPHERAVALAVVARTHAYLDALCAELEQVPVGPPSAALVCYSGALSIAELYGLATAAVRISNRADRRRLTLLVPDHHVFSEQRWEVPPWLRTDRQTDGTWLLDALAGSPLSFVDDLSTMVAIEETYSSIAESLTSNFPDGLDLLAHACRSSVTARVAISWHALLARDAKEALTRAERPSRVGPTAGGMVRMPSSSSAEHDALEARAALARHVHALVSLAHVMPTLGARIAGALREVASESVATLALNDSSKLLSDLVSMDAVSSPVQFQSLLSLALVVAEEGPVLDKCNTISDCETYASAIARQSRTATPSGVELAVITSESEFESRVCSAVMDLSSAAAAQASRGEWRPALVQWVKTLGVAGLLHSSLLSLRATVPTRCARLLEAALVRGALVVDSKREGGGTALALLVEALRKEGVRIAWQHSVEEFEALLAKDPLRKPVLDVLRGKHVSPPAGVDVTWNPPAVGASSSRMTLREEFVLPPWCSDMRLDAPGMRQELGGRRPVAPLFKLPTRTAPLFDMVSDIEWALSPEQPGTALELNRFALAVQCVNLELCRSLATSKGEDLERVLFHWLQQLTVHGRASVIAATPASKSFVVVQSEASDELAIEDSVVSDIILSLERAQPVSGASLNSLSKHREWKPWSNTGPCSVPVVPVDMDADSRATHALSAQPETVPLLEKTRPGAFEHPMDSVREARLIASVWSFLRSGCKDEDLFHLCSEYGAPAVAGAFHCISPTSLFSCSSASPGDAVGGAWIKMLSQTRVAAEAAASDAELQAASWAPSSARAKRINDSVSVGPDADESLGRWIHSAKLLHAALYWASAGDPAKAAQAASRAGGGWPSILWASLVAVLRSRQVTRQASSLSEEHTLHPSLPGMLTVVRQAVHALEASQSPANVRPALDAAQAVVERSPLAMSANLRAAVVPLLPEALVSTSVVSLAARSAAFQFARAVSHWGFAHTTAAALMAARSGDSLPVLHEAIGLIQGVAGLSWTLLDSVREDTPVGQEFFPVWENLLLSASRTAALVLEDLGIDAVAKRTARQALDGALAESIRDRLVRVVRLGVSASVRLLRLENACQLLMLLPAGEAAIWIAAMLQLPALAEAGAPFRKDLYMRMIDSCGPRVMTAGLRLAVAGSLDSDSNGRHLPPTSPDGTSLSARTISIVAEVARTAFAISARGGGHETWYVGIEGASAAFAGACELSRLAAQSTDGAGAHQCIVNTWLSPPSLETAGSSLGSLLSELIKHCPEGHDDGAMGADDADGSECLKRVAECLAQDADLWDVSWASHGLERLPPAGRGAVERRLLVAESAFWVEFAQSLSATAELTSKLVPSGEVWSILYPTAPQSLEEDDGLSFHIAACIGLDAVAAEALSRCSATGLESLTASVRGDSDAVDRMWQQSLRSSYALHGASVLVPGDLQSSVLSCGASSVELLGGMRLNHLVRPRPPAPESLDRSRGWVLQAILTHRLDTAARSAAWILTCSTWAMEHRREIPGAETLSLRFRTECAERLQLALAGAFPGLHTPAGRSDDLVPLLSPRVLWIAEQVVRLQGGIPW